jgi:hypothetical protein
MTPTAAAATAKARLFPDIPFLPSRYFKAYLVHPRFDLVEPADHLVSVMQGDPTSYVSAAGASFVSRRQKNSASQRKFTTIISVICMGLQYHND